MTKIIKIEVDDHIEPLVIEELINAIIPNALPISSVIEPRLENISELCSLLSQLINNSISADETINAFHTIENEIKIIQALSLGLTDKKGGL